MSTDLMLLPDYLDDSLDSLEDDITPQPPVFPDLGLRPYQTEALNASLEAWERGVWKQVIAMATGGGKTRTGVAIARAVLDEDPHLVTHGGRCLWLVHRKELIDQAYEAFCLAFDKRDVGIVQAERNFPGTRHVIASIPTLATEKRLRQLLSYGHFSLVIVDEAHHSTAKRYRDLLGTLKDPASPLIASGETLLIGLTATPSRADGISLGVVFEELVYSIGILDLIASAPPALADLRGIRVQAGDLDLSAVKLMKGGDDYDQKQLEAAIARSVADRSRYTAALHTLLTDRRVKGKQGIYFGVNRHDAFAYAEVANAAGIVTEVLTGATLVDDRRDIFTRFKNGETQYIANVDVLSEGTDLPMAAVAIMGRHTRSAERYLQNIGRICRLWPGKKCGYVIDLCDNQHSILVLPELIGTTELSMAKKSVRELVTDETIRPEPRNIEVVYQPSAKEPHVTDTSLFTNRHWRKVGALYELKTPYGLFRAEQRFGDTYQMEQYHLESGEHEKTLSKPLRLDHALAHGEQQLQLLELRWKRQNDPRERSKFATKVQIDALRKVKIPIAPNARLTQGQVQDYWDQLKAAGGPAGWWAQKRKVAS